MSNASPAPETVIRRAVRVALRGVRVGLPGQIASYNSATCEADVQPLIMEAQPQPDGTVITAPLPIVPHVPVLFVGGGGSRLTFPVKAGDTCYLMFASSSLDRWLALGGTIDPQDDRHHHLTDGVALVGLFDFAHVTPAHATATVLEGADVRLGDASGGALATKADVDALADWIHTTMIVNATGATAGTTTAPPSAAGTSKVKAT